MREAIAEAVRKPTPEEEEESRAFDEQEALMKWYLGQREEEAERTIQAFNDRQAKGEQISVVDSFLGLFGGAKADEDPSSSSSSVVQPSGKAAAPKKTATPEKPFADKVTVRSKDFDLPHARLYQGGDPNRMRQREAKLIGA